MKPSYRVIWGVVMLFMFGLPLALFSVQQKQQTDTKAAPAQTSQQSAYADTANGLSTDPNFFPISVWNQSNVASSAQYRDVGVNIFVGLYSPTTEANLSTLKGNSMQVIPEQNSVGLNSANKDIIVGWLQQDEPDNAQPNGSGGFGPCVPASQMVTRYNQIKAADPQKKPVMLNLGRGVADPNWEGRGSCSGQSDYPGYMPAGDIISFDVYPINDNLPITYVADGVDNLKRWSNNQKPVVAVLETTRINAGPKPTPNQTKAEVWLALTHGADGIMYFAHQFQPFAEAGFLQDAAMSAMIKSVNAQIKSLAPVLNSPTVTGGATVASSQRIDVITKVFNNETYVFAVSPNAGTNTATFTIPSIASGTVTVIDENRTVTLAGNKFQDTFAAYGVHLYKISGGTAGGTAPTSTFTTYTPTFGVIAPCPSCVAPTVASTNGGPTNPIGGGEPNPTTAIHQSPSTTTPCLATDTSLAQDHRSKHKIHDGSISGFIEQLLKFFIELLNMLLQLIGGGQIPVPNPNPAPQPDENPNPAPCLEPSEPLAVPTQASQPTSAQQQPTTVQQPTNAQQPTQAPGTNTSLKGWQLTTANVGLASQGLTCGALPVYTGNYKPAAGTVISNVRFLRPLDLSNGSITIQRSCMQPTTFGRGLPLILTYDNNRNTAPAPTKVIIRDSEIDGSLLGTQNNALTTGFIGAADLINNYIHDVGSGIGLMNTGDHLSVLVENNYVIHLTAWGDPRTNGNHSDGFTIRDFDISSTPGRTAMIRGNRINCDSANSTGAFFIQTYSGNIGNMTAQDNLLEGNTYQLVLGAGFGHAYSNMRAINNRMTGTGYGWGYVADGPGWSAFSENYINDPTKPDNKGRAIAAP